MKKVLSHNFIIIFAFFMLFSLAAGLFPAARTRFSASAAEATSYSNVLDDLKKDSAFNEKNYPQNPSDYSVNVIQIAESVNKELFVYVYLPCTSKGLKPTSINISRYEGDNTSYQNYKLKKLNGSGQFEKYLVEDFSLHLNKNTRIYNISSIFRAWNSSVDKPAQGGNVTSEVSYEVAKCFAASWEGTSVTYECRAVETVLVTDKYCGHLQYNRGDLLFGLILSEDTDAFYVAFTADYPIEKLLEADVYFVSREAEDTTVTIMHHTETTTKYGDPVENHVNLFSTNSVKISGDKGLLNFSKYEWKEIESIAEFKKNEKLTQEAINKLYGKKWVLRFAQFNRLYVNIGAAHGTRRTEVSDVTILRLKFETEGTVYNLGVVDNKTTPAPDAPPDNEQKNPLNPTNPSASNKGTSFWSWLGDLFTRLFKGDLVWWEWIIVAIIGIVILLCIPLIIQLIPLLFSVLKGIVWIVILPFRLTAQAIKSLSKRNEKRKRAKAQKEKNKNSEKQNETDETDN